MKIIISHDVDHLFLKEHLKDSFLLGNLYRSLKQVAEGNISLNTLLKRFPAQLNRVKELHEFNKKAGIKETFFFGMRKGLNLSYDWKDTQPFIDYLVKEKVLIGMHGMGYNSFDLLKEEANRLKTMLPKHYPLGIRNHYLRMDESTLGIMEKIGFLFDSTYYTTDDAKYHTADAVFLQGNIWEIPINIMDAGFVSNNQKELIDIKIKTLAKIQKAENNNQPFFVINFHDLYFSDAYPVYKQWYEWLISYFLEQNYEFIDFLQALQILNKQTVNADRFN
jgi:peptidoglycan/xylan/chitin deacetylase (PgdA/CDA1 family)